MDYKKKNILTSKLLVAVSFQFFIIAQKCYGLLIDLV
jgi:hypothetical protein